MIGSSSLAAVAAACAVAWAAMSAAGNRKHLLYFAVALVLLLGNALYQDYISDDAFISFRYARNLADGHGLVFNPGERVEGYTNFLWVLLLALIDRFGGDIVTSGRVLGFVLSAATLWILLRFSSTLKREVPPHFRISILLLSASAPFAVWALAGLETSLFTCLVVSGFFELEEGRARRAAVWLSLSALARPEGVIFLGIAAVLHAAAAPRRRRIGSLLPVFLPAMLILVPFEIWRIAYYGEIVPNTFYAKTGGGLHQVLRGLKYVVKYFWLYGGFFTFFATGALALLRSGAGGLRRLAFVTGAYLVYVALVGGDGLPAHRFVVPVIPFICLLLEAGVYELVDVARPVLRARVKTAAFSSLAVAVLLLSSWVGYRERETNRLISRDFILIGKWLAEAAPEGASIAVSAAGAIPFYSGLVTVDRLGLTDKHIARRRMPGMGKGPAGHEKHDAEYVLSRRPTILTLDWNGLCDQPIEGKRGSEIETILQFSFDGRDIWADPEFHSLYEPRSVELRPGGWFNYFELKGSGSWSQPARSG